jgi:quinol-cytochrome oxidoreductase complex cytochrome b subunit
MFLTIFFGYSGYLLPWDSLAYGAAVIGINMANSSPLIGKIASTALFGGTSLTPRTVTRMYFIHVFILPVIVTLLIIIHLFIVWVQGIAEPH